MPAEAKAEKEKELAELKGFAEKRKEEERDRATVVRYRYLKFVGMVNHDDKYAAL